MSCMRHQFQYFVLPVAHLLSTDIRNDMQFTMISDVAVPKDRHNRKWYSRLRMLLLRTLTCTCVPAHPNIQSPLSN
ncbi:hypothetical protein OUZ56_017788 [Daphnia magna]|uniref:Uncharacterized protein n=1 Tax=Daphnia magna TaxID=35525 RepID=A0ABR0ATT6_9CRUS|nr:hypothetical protein OUZ56_017788 [Daphnia magna]